MNVIRIYLLPRLLMPPKIGIVTRRIPLGFRSELGEYASSPMESRAVPDDSRHF